MKIAIIGECMLELSVTDDQPSALKFGGDTLNTAVYLTRCGGEADYFTVVGDDNFSKNMLHSWQQEGIGTSKVKVKKGSLPGLYMIENDANGERYFHYWKDSSPAKKLFEDYPEVTKELMNYPMIYLTGITLSLYSQKDRDYLYSFFEDYRQGGGIVAFDNNYRVINWPDTDTATFNFNTMMSLTDIALISFDDELSLRGAHSIVECVSRWKLAGVSELVVKNGEQGCLISIGNITELIQLESVLTPLDTTAAGDSFNGAYLAAKSSGDSAKVAISKAQTCASIVIQYKGAIVDSDLF